MNRALVGTAVGTAAGRWNRWHVVLAVALAVQLAVSLLVVGGGRAGAPASSAGLGDAGGGHPAAGTTLAGDFAEGLSPDAATASMPAPAPAPAPIPPAPAAVPGVAPGQALPSLQDAGPLVVPDPGPLPSSEPGPNGAGVGLVPSTFAASAPGSPSEQIFAREHPTHAAARQRDDVASSFHWAVIIGVNDYMGRTSSTVGSVGDALALRDTLYSRGWRGDQVLTLTDHAATHDQIVRAIEWLIRSTDHRSTVVFSFSGHMRHNAGVTALWPADNRFLWAGDLGRMLGAVRADRMWVSLNGCHAAGLAAPGLEGANRVVTYASGVPEKAYEDPSVGHSVMGYYLYAQGLRDGRGDQHGNRDGRVSAQEAFAWAAPNATQRTTGQSHGPQRPVIVDGLAGREFPIAVTGAPAPAAAPRSAAGDGGGKGDGNGRTLPRLPSLDLPDVGVGALPGGILD